jgi:hypothetical protein
MNVKLEKQRRVVENKDGTKVLQERFMHVECNTEENNKDVFVCYHKWEDICTITTEMQKEPAALLNCIMGWLSQ